MDTNTITRIPLKYWPILNSLDDCSVGKIFKNILWWNETLSDHEQIYFDLIMVDVDAIDNRANGGIKWKEHWKLGWRPTKKRKTPKVSKTKTPNINKTNINKDKILYLDYIYLTNIEYNKLIDSYNKNIIDKYINNINNYIWSTGKKYKSHYHTILNWLNRDWVKKKEHKEYIEAPTTDDFFTSLDKELWLN